MQRIKLISDDVESLEQLRDAMIASGIWQRILNGVDGDRLYRGANFYWNMVVLEEVKPVTVRLMYGRVDRGIPLMPDGCAELTVHQQALVLQWAEKHGGFCSLARFVDDFMVAFRSWTVLQRDSMEAAA
jgi:hypothetical protein